MAGEFERLDILIRILNKRALENIDQLIRKIRQLQAVVENVRKIVINVEVRDSELQRLKADLATLGDEDVHVDDSGVTDAVDKAMTQRERMIRKLSAIDSKLLFGNTQRASIIMQLQSGVGGGEGLGALGDPQAVAEAMAQIFRRGKGGDAIRRGRPEELTTAQSIFNIKQRDINNALAKFLPMFLAFKFALPAAIAGIIGLAAAAAGAAVALGSIAALGLMGMAAERTGGAPTMEALQEILMELVETAIDIFLPLARRLAPLMERGFAGLERVLVSVEKALSPILNMRGDAADFARFVGRVLPRGIRGLLIAAQVVMPLFRRFAAAIESTSPIEYFLDALVKTEPQLMRLGESLFTMLPRLVELSRGFLDVASRMLQFISFIVRLVTSVGVANRHIGRMIAVMGMLFTALSIVNAMYTFNLIPNIMAMVTSLWKNIGAMLVYVGATNAATVATAIHTASKWKLVAATIALIGVIGVLTGGLSLLLGMIGGVASKSVLAADGLGSFNNELERTQRNMGKDFDHESQRTSREAHETARGRTTNVTTTFELYGDSDTDDIETRMNNVAWRARNT